MKQKRESNRKRGRNRRISGVNLSGLGSNISMTSFPSTSMNRNCLSGRSSFGAGTSTALGTAADSTGRNNVRLSLPFANNKTNLPWLLSKNAIDTDSTAKDGESIHQSDEMLK